MQPYEQVLLKLLLPSRSSLVQVSKSCYRSSICILRVRIGIKDLLEGLNAQLLSTIHTELDKVDGQSPPEPTRVSADVANMAPQGGGSGKGAAAADPLDDLFPRVEIDGLLKGTTILADAKSDAWKTKKEALETLQAILDQGANKRLKPQMGMPNPHNHHYFQQFLTVFPRR